MNSFHRILCDNAANSFLFIVAVHRFYNHLIKTSNQSNSVYPCCRLTAPRYTKRTGKKEKRKAREIEHVSVWLTRTSKNANSTCISRDINWSANGISRSSSIQISFCHFSRVSHHFYVLIISSLFSSFIVPFYHGWYLSFSSFLHYAIFHPSFRFHLLFFFFYTLSFFVLYSLFPLSS